MSASSCQLTKSWRRARELRVTSAKPAPKSKLAATFKMAGMFLSVTRDRGVLSNCCGTPPKSRYDAGVSVINFHTKEISVKIVYYGPGLCGKTTSLQTIYASLPPERRPQ